jgi:peptidoglycan/LPS O-acetylase OafA/YrhL
MRYRSDIDGLRAVAVLSVVLFHARVPGISGGFVGVDIFFVISGYLICSLIATELRSHSFSLARFYERRCRRILPALIAMLLAVSVVAPCVLLPPDMLAYSRSLVAAVFFTSNIYFWRSANYFDGASQFKPLLHTWSLGVEEQFYILMPLALMLIASRGRFAYGRWLAPMWVASFACSVWGLTHIPTADFYILPTRLWELTTGALVALAMPDRPLPRAARELVGLTGAGLCIYSITMLSEVSPFPGWHALFPCLGAAAIIYQGRSGRSAVTDLLSTRLCVFVGQISYSLYLWHWPVLALARYEAASRELRPAEIAAALLTSLFAAVVSWRYVERPFRDRGRMSVGATVKVCAAGSALLLVMGFSGVLSRGLAAYHPDFTEVKIPKGGYSQGTCFLDINQAFDAWRGSDCYLTQGHGSTTLLWGDSFAAHYAPGIARRAEQTSADFLQFTAVGCPPIFGYYSAAFPNCREINEHLPEVLGKYHVRSVIMSARWEALFRRGVQMEKLTATVERLKSFGVSVYVIGQSPVFNNDVQVIFAKQGGHAGDPDGTAPLSFDRHINEALQKAIPFGTFIDPLRIMCDPPLCRFRRNGQFIVADEGHLSAFGSDMAVAAYFPFVSRQVVAGAAATP